jgi:hypothetical protein
MPKKAGFDPTHQADGPGGRAQAHHGPPTAPHLGIFQAASCFLSLDSRVSGVHQLEPVEELGYDFDTSNLDLDIF